MRGQQNEPADPGAPVTEEAPSASTATVLGPAPLTLPRPTRRDLQIAGIMAVASVLIVLPYLLGGPGFFMDDWRNLARLDTVGWLRSAEASRFASRPGAWSVEMVLYPVLRDNAVAWVFTLAALNAAAATAVAVCLRRFVAEQAAVVTALVWIVLPNHTSLRTFPNVAPMVVGLILLTVGILLMDSRRLVPGAIAVALGGFCLEVMLLPGLVALGALHHWRGRGTRREAWIGAGIIVTAAGLMLIHPTYSVANAVRGTPAPIWPAHFGAGLTTVPAIAWTLSGIAIAGMAIAVVAVVRDRHRTTDGHWLILAGITVIVVGLAPFVLKWPAAYRGMADRNFVVSSVGSAMVWAGIGYLIWQRSRAIAAVAGIAFCTLMVSTNVTYQSDWSMIARQTPDMLRAVQCRYGDDPPKQLGVGPTVPGQGGVRALHWFFLEDATRVVLGRPLEFDLAETDQEWRERPEELQVTWDELLAEGCDG